MAKKKTGATKKKPASKKRVSTRSRRPVSSGGDVQVASVRYQWAFDGTAVYKVRIADARIWSSWNGARFTDFSPAIGAGDWRLHAGPNRLFLLNARNGEVLRAQQGLSGFNRIVSPRGTGTYQIAVMSANSIYLSNTRTGYTWRWMSTSSARRVYGTPSSRLIGLRGSGRHNAYIVDTASSTYRSYRGANFNLIPG